MSRIQAFIAALVLSVSVRLAIAQPDAAPDPPDSPAVDPDPTAVLVGSDPRYREALTHDDRGKRFFHDKDYVAAAMEFREAYRAFAALGGGEDPAVAATARELGRKALTRQATAFSYAKMPVDAYDALDTLRAVFAAELEPEVAQSIEVSLESLAKVIGRVRLTGVRSGSELRVDGRVAEPDLATGSLRVAAGRHALEVRAAGFQPFLTSFSVTGQGEVTVAVTMTPLNTHARVRIDSDVQPATVSIDGKTVGSAPVEAPLAPGDHRYRVTSEGHRAASGSFSVGPGERVLINAGLVPSRRPLGVRFVPRFGAVIMFRNDTPLNGGLEPEDDLTDGSRFTTGGRASVYLTTIRFRGLLFGMDTQYQDRAVNKVSIGPIASWCPDRFARHRPDGGGGGQWCPIDVAALLNVVGGEHGPFTGGQNSLRAGTHFDALFGPVVMTFGAGVVYETYTRSALVKLGASGAYIEAGVGIDL
ncbi:MAG TPA: PEGA domain-containing protein [Kofleriaceae bacterium]|nr:PEGA domain-containing protein [Kofleriaceae bacterium]